MRLRISLSFRAQFVIKKILEHLPIAYFKAPSIDGWPDDGGVKFDDYATRYRPDLEDVVKGLNLEVSSGEKLGICGRTGAGKSSLTLALFRIINASKGRLLVGGRDVATVGLQELRSQITIIPQDPVLFSGTVRCSMRHCLL